MVCVTTLPCKILMTTLLMFTCVKQSSRPSTSVIIIGNFSQTFMGIILEESYGTDMTYLQVTVRPSCDREIMVMVAHDAMT